ncbi:TPA: hypothetical protein DDW35_02540, partial [Candidatus Sumerlaeota bacterium]|nr:hypothetical protein [Candidatus Sumerlaeota bacterium]
NPASICSQTRSIESMGGGIFIYDALQAAGREILQAKQLNKHILLFADAADSEEPGDYKNLVADFVKSGVTVSVVGLGTEHDKDAELLKDIAKIGKGSVYFTEDAAQLTQFFTADAITYTRNSFVTEPAPMKIRSGSLTVSPGHNWTDFSCAGYNLLFVKPDAEIAIQTVDEDQAPTLAFWQKELGRVAAFAFDTDGAFANQKQFGDILLSSVRWIMGSNVEDNLQIRTTYEGNYARIRMEVSDQERAAMGAATLQLFTPDGKTITRPLSWDSLNQLSSTAKLEQTGCYRGVIQAGGKTYRIPPISLPVSPELAANRPPDFGKNKLVQLATLTEGREIMDVRDLFERTQTSHVVSPVVRPFLILFLVLMLLEIAEPRFGVLGMLRKIMRSSWGFLRRRRQPKTALATQGSSLVHSATETTPLARVQEEKRGDTVASADAPAVSPAASSDMDYLRHTKRQFNRNMRKPKR